MVVTLFQPKPWLDLFRTDFVHLRAQRERELHLLFPVNLALPSPFPPLKHSKRLNPAPVALGSHSPTDHLSTSSAVAGEQELATSASDSSFDVLALPSEVIHAIFSRLEPEHLCVAAQVCSKWLAHAYDPRHWKRIALRTWPLTPAFHLERLLYIYKTWRKLATLRPRLRTNAIYVTCHRFAKTACRAAINQSIPPVFLVSYYRLLRFYPDGVVVSLTTPESPDLAYRRLRRAWFPSHLDRDKAHPAVGTYSFDEHTSRVELQLPMAQPKFPDMCPGTMYMTFALDSTVRGACNRLYLLDHHAIMDDDGGDLVSYPAALHAQRPFRLVPLYGFRTLVDREFPRDDDRDLAQWHEMKKASRVERARAAAAAR